VTVQVSKLANGLTVASDHMAHVETATLGVWVAAGTRNERPEVNGVAHLLEHMAFKGTERRSAQAIAEEIEAVGGQLNAYTSRENTAFYVRVLKQDLALAVDLLADILQHSVFDETELGRERDVVLQEIGQACDTPDDIVFDHFQQTAFPEQPLGWPVLGTAGIVAAMPRQALIDYMAESYAASRMVLSAAGNVTHQALVELADAAFGRLASARRGTVVAARYRGGDYREDRDLEQVHLVIDFDGVAYDDPDYYALTVLSMLFGGGMSSRLFQELREKRGLVYNVHSFSSAYVDGGLFGIYAGTGSRQLAELVPVICEEIGKLGEAVSAEEVDRARTQVKAGLLMAQESTGARCEQLAQQIRVYGRPQPLAELGARLDAVDGAAVTRLARRLGASRLTCAAMGPLAELEPYDAIAARLG